MMKLFQRRSAKEWYELLTRAYADRDNATISVNKWWKTRVAAERGLISCGIDAIPYAVELLDSRDPDIREDGAAVLAALGDNELVVDALLRALEKETEDQPRDMLIIGLGQLRNKKAIPFLAMTIRDPDTDGDTRFTAIQSLGQIARRRFDRSAEPEAAAVEWLDAHGY
jgi:HEAT repeat protein